MNAQGVDGNRVDDRVLAELDAYSSDGQYIGTVAGFLPLEPDNEQASETGIFDVVGFDGKPEGSRRVLIDGIGTIIQTRIAVPAGQLTVDLKGRRITVPLTVAEIEQLPRREP